MSTPSGRRTRAPPRRRSRRRRPRRRRALRPSNVASRSATTRARSRSLPRSPTRARTPTTAPSTSCRLGFGLGSGSGSGLGLVTLTLSLTVTLTLTLTLTLPLTILADGLLLDELRPRVRRRRLHRGSHVLQLRRRLDDAGGARLFRHGQWRRQLCRRELWGLQPTVGSAVLRAWARRLRLCRLDARIGRWRLPDKRHARGLRG